MFEFQLTDEISFAVSVAMVLAILFLGVRMHQNTRAVRSGNRQACLTFTSKVYSELAADKQLAKLFRKGLNDFAALSVEDKVRLHYYLQSIVTLFRDAVNAYNEEVISKEEYESNRASTMAVLCMPGGKVWWQDAQNAYPQEIREALNLQGDTSYALGDIYPYFLIADDEEVIEEKVLEDGELFISEEVGFSAADDDSEWEIINQPVTAASLSDDLHASEPESEFAQEPELIDNHNESAQLSEQAPAANEDIQIPAAASKPDWRKGLARRQSR
ncbi:MAG: hypothetical protein AB8B48_18415 [Pseudomonadales bacterium]